MRCIGQSACHVTRYVALILVAALFLPSHSFADASRLTNSFPITAGATTGTKRTDVAYDPVNDIYLVTTGGTAFPGTISGRFVQGDGTVVGGMFKIPETMAHAQSARVTYSADLGGFLVVWLDTRADQVKYTAQVWGRFVKFSAGGTPVFPFGDLYIDNATGGVNPEVPPVPVCAPGLNECLVAWHQFGGGAEPSNDVHAARISSATGQLLGSELAMSNDNWWQGMPAVNYDPSSQTYLVAFSVYTNVAQIWVRRVQAGTGAILGDPVNLATSGGIFVPDIGVNAATHQFFVTWYDGNARSFYGRYVNNDGSLATGVIPLLIGYGGNDAFGIAYNSTTGTFFAVTHGLSVDDVGFQVLANGTPQGVFNITAATGVRNGNFNPRVAASPQRAEWLATTSTDFVTVFGTRIGSSDRSGDTPPPPGGPGPTPQPTLIDLAAADVPNGSWFLAEGAANGSANGFKTYYEIQNSNPVDVSVRGYFADEAGNATMKMFTVPKQSRITVSLMEQVGGGSFGSVFQSLSTDASCPGGHCDIDVERSIYWGPNLEGSTDATAVKNLSTTWYFAEGSRGGELFNNYFMLFNPTQSTATVTGSYLRADGQVVARSYAVGPQQRLTIDANAINRDANTPVGLEGVDFSATFASNVPIVAERSMYWGYTPANGWIGGHGTMGAPALNWFWAFAEGNAAPNFETFYEIMNPNPYPILVNATFMTEYSGNISQQYAVGANSRFTVPMNVFFGNIGPMGAAFSSTDGGFLAERSIYWGNRVEGTNTIGSPGIAAEWHLPEGASGGMFDTFLMLLNPTNTPVTIDMTLYVEGIGQITLPETMRPVLQPTSRLTLNMKDVLHELEPLVGIPLVGHSFSTRVKVFGAGQIVAEHAIYWNFVDGQTYWRSGGASMGIPH